MLHRSTRSLVVCVAVLAASLGTAVPSSPAVQRASAAAFTVQGSIEQIATWGHAVGATVVLRDAADAVIATRTADAQGAVLFRDLAPGAGYTVTDGDVVSEDVTVTSPDDHPDASFYEGITLQEGFGYIPTRDGTLLSVNIEFPTLSGPGPWPVVVEYSGYDPSRPGALPEESRIYPYFGYVVVAVNLRGTTCSGGAFWFMEQAQRTDGYDVIEAVAHQSWSTGDVGMVGISYSGYSQLYVASTQPPHLRAITPLSPFSDMYRGILYPGGILNDGFATDWALERQADAEPAAHQWVKNRISGGDTTCAANQVMRLQSQDIASELVDGRFADDQYEYLDPTTFVPEIRVPTYLATQWQDEQTGGAGAEIATMIAPNAYLRAEFTNGTHTDPLGPEEFLRVTEFIDFFVGKRIPVQQGNNLFRLAITQGLQALFGGTITLPPNRFAGRIFYANALASYLAEEPIRIRWENGGVTGTEGQPYATAVSGYSSWPIPEVDVQRWFLQPDGELGLDAPTIPAGARRGVSSYVYDASVKRATSYSGSTESMWLAHPDVRWDVESEGHSLSFLTPPFGSTAAYAGTGSADLWLRSTAADTDLEVTLTEVRPDGTEMAIQSGWLRASRRALDEAASTPLRPRQTFRATDAAPLPSGEYVPVRVELFPFAHVVRPGSRLRLNIEAPGGNQPFWSFAALSGTSTNDIAHATDMPSSVALPLLDDATLTSSVPTDPPSCSVEGVTTQSHSSRNQPCRDAVPSRAPSDVVATATTNRTTVTWQPPTTAPGAQTPTGYRVSRSGSTTTIDTSADVMTATFTGLSDAASIEFTVSAIHGDEVGPAASWSLPVTVPRPTALSAEAGNRSLRLGWRAPRRGPNAIVGYTVRPVRDGVPQAEVAIDGDVTTAVLTRLRNGSRYTVTLLARYVDGTRGPVSVRSDAVVVGTPGAPTGVGRQVVGARSVRVSWTAAPAHGSPIERYVVTPWLGQTALPSIRVGGDRTSRVVDGLRRDRTYTFTVRAVNARGAGPWSRPSRPVTVAARPDRSSHPT